MVVTRHTSSAAETESLGAELAARLQAGDVVLLIGDLGAGKTTFVRGAARALGVSAPVTSPTFTIGQRYRASGGPVAVVSHLDLYRLTSLRDEDPDLLADYVGNDMIAFVEWPDVGTDELATLADRVLTVKLAHAGGDRREVVLP